MAFRRLMVQPVTIFNLVDPAPVPTTGFSDDDPPTFDTGYDTKGWVNPLTAEEDTQERDTRVTDYLLYLPPEENIKATSEVVWKGVRHRIIGRPRLFDNLRGPHHFEIVMRAVEG